MTVFFFYFGLSIHISLAFVAALVKIKQSRYLWPPPQKGSWEYLVVFWSLRLMVVCVLIISITSWGSFNIPNWIRFGIAAPLFVVCWSLGTVGVVQLGWHNTHGEAQRFISHGIYRFSRNPQYFFYAISFVCLGILIDSWEVIVLLVVTGTWYLLAPFAEEPWLEEKYGKDYLHYKDRVPRYFGFGPRGK